jgi:hypothetical protein
MTWKRVDKYWLGFNYPKKKFYFYYKLNDDNNVYQFNVTPEQFLGLSDMFRNEGPISYNTDGKYFVTAAEGIGEGEVKQP